MQNTQRKAIIFAALMSVVVLLFPPIQQLNGAAAGYGFLLSLESYQKIDVTRLAVHIVLVLCIGIALMFRATAAGGMKNSWLGKVRLVISKVWLGEMPLSYILLLWLTGLVVAKLYFDGFQNNLLLTYLGTAVFLSFLTLTSVGIWRLSKVSATPSPYQSFGYFALVINVCALFVTIGNIGTARYMDAHKKVGIEAAAEEIAKKYK